MQEGGAVSQLRLNVEELTAWCERHGLNASEIAAGPVTATHERGRLVYALRRWVGNAGDEPQFVPAAVSVPLDDPMPPLYLH